MILAWGVLGLLGLTFVIVDSNINGARTVPISVWIMGMFFAAIGTTANRFIYRLIRHITSSGSSSGKAKRNVMVIGAGACGKDVIHEYKISENLTSKVCCIIDDNPEKKGRMLEGVEIVGNRNDIPKMVGKYGFVKASEFLSSGAYALVGYVLKNTLSDNGTVTRGICSVEGGKLVGIAETKNIMKTSDGASADGVELDEPRVDEFLVLSSGVLRCS